MATLFTSLRIATVLLAVSVYTTSALAQQATHRATPAKRTTAAVKSQTASGKKSQTTTRLARPSATVQSQPSTSNQPKAQPVVVAAQTSQANQTTAARPELTRSSVVRSNQPMGSSRNKYLNVGFGLAAYYGGGLPLGISLEVDAKNNISLGGSLDYLRYGYNSGGYKWNYTFIYAGVRASYHLGEVLNVQNKQFDPYAGVTLGLRYAGYNDTYGYDGYASPYNSGLFLGAHVGARYFFNEKLGGFAEVGYGVSALKLGLTAKF